MALYEFECKKCGNIFEEFMRGDIQEIKCPKCSSDQTLKNLTISNFIIKGSCSNPMNPKEEKVTEKTVEKDKMVLSDWYCPKCDYVLEDEFALTNAKIKCPECKKGNLKRVIGNLNFKLLYDPKKDLFDWQGNRTQYWSSVKEERRKGRDVKGFNEK